MSWFWIGWILDGSQQAAILAQKNTGHGSKNNENPKDQTEAGSSNMTENSRSETVLPKIKPIPAEADLIPPKTYKAIVANKKLKEKVGTTGGITSGQDPIECGSFYNNSDNRVARSVYKEDLISMLVTSMSFNPKTWLCTACPSSLGRYVFGSEISYNKAPPRLPGLGC